MINKETLEELYLNQELAMHEIADKLNVSVGSVYNYIKEFGIKSRPRMSEKTRAKISNSQKGKPSARKGCKLSAETKRKISESHKGKFIVKSKYGGHRKKRTDGYIMVYVPDHPLATKEGYVMEHILVMEKHIGRYITRDEVVHHINENRSDNRIENLRLMTFKEHAKFHLEERRKQGKLNHYTKAVINTDTGEIFDSVKSAAVKYGVAATNISRSCRTNRKVKNCKWEYVN